MTTDECDFRVPQKMQAGAGARVVGWVLVPTVLLVCSLLFGTTASAQQPPSGKTPAAANPTSTTPGGAAKADAAKGPKSYTFLEILFSGGVTGVLIMLLLIGLSIAALALMIEHAFTIREPLLIPPGVAERVREQLAAGNLTAADQICQTKPSMLSFVLRAGLAEVDGGWAAVEKGTEDALAEQAARLSRKIEYLAVLGNIGPMVGLLGTVVGMIFAFQEVAETQGAARAADLAEGIYQALVTTVVGLLIAIPSLGVFAIFRNRVDHLVAEAAYEVQHALTPLKRGRRRTAGQAPPPPPAGAA